MNVAQAGGNHHLHKNLTPVRILFKNIGSHRLSLSFRVTFWTPTNLYHPGIWRGRYYGIYDGYMHGIYCIPYFFWQFLIMAVGLIFSSVGRRARWNQLRWTLEWTIDSWPALRGGPSTIFGVFATPQFVPVLFTVYLLHELKVPSNRMQGWRGARVPENVGSDRPTSCCSCLGF
jgi:hypothetical protein